MLLNCQSFPAPPYKPSCTHVTSPGFLSNQVSKSILKCLEWKFHLIGGQEKAGSFLPPWLYVRLTQHALLLAELFLSHLTQISWAHRYLLELWEIKYFQPYGWGRSILLKIYSGKIYSGKCMVKSEYFISCLLTWDQAQGPIVSREGG